MRNVYLDNNATTPVDSSVLEEMMPYLKENFGNPSSLHQYGRKIRVKLDEARGKIAALIGADASEIVFTSGGSEADNFAIKGAAFANKEKGNHLITSKIEHPAVLNTCKYLERTGFKVTYVGVDKDGVINLSELEKAIIPETILVSIHHSNNEIGTIQPITEIGNMLRGKGIIFHTDAVQSVGKISLDVKEMGVDLLAISGHKIYGPKGVGALYIRKGLNKIHPLIHGGAHEKKRRAGTENVPGIIGFGKAAEIALRDLAVDSERLVNMRDALYEKLSDKITHMKLNGHPTQRLPNTLNVSFEFAEGETLMINLDLEGVAISTGSACSSGSLEPSHVLLAMGMPYELIHGSLRFSFGKYNTMEDVDYVSEVLPPIVKRVREMSPFWEEKP